MNLNIRLEVRVDANVDGLTDKLMDVLPYQVFGVILMLNFHRGLGAVEK